MYIKKSTGYIIGAANACSPEKACDNNPYQVVKTGRVLKSMEEGITSLKKHVDIAFMINPWLVYYQVIGNQGACERCEEHNGAIYPVAQAKAGETLPPFHPNCKCEVREFIAENPNHDPHLAETLFWLDIMYGDGAMEQKAQKMLDYYQWTEFSVAFITGILLSIEPIGHIAKRKEAFFAQLQEGEHITVNDWLRLYTRPTVAGVGRRVEMPRLEGWHPNSWYAFEGRTDINEWAKYQMELLGVPYEVHVGDMGEVTDAEGRYWIAVGPNVMNPDHLPSEGISPEEMYGRAKLDVVLQHDDGTVYYLPCVVGDAKAHTWPNGMLQTGYAFPDGGDPFPHPIPEGPVEFIGLVQTKYLKDYALLYIIVYE